MKSSSMNNFGIDTKNWVSSDGSILAQSCRQRKIS